MNVEVLRKHAEARQHLGDDYRVSIRAIDAEALCDLVDAARDYESAPSYTANCDCLDCSRYRSKVMDAHERMHAALARLDGDSGGAA